MQDEIKHLWIIAEALLRADDDVIDDGKRQEALFHIGAALDAITGCDPDDDDQLPVAATLH